MGRRVALLVASYDYQDPGLRRLTAPAQDAESLAAVLQDPDIAGFDVTILINEPHYRVGEVIGGFYRERRSDDLTLLYFTGHGLKDDGGRLYLAMSNTRRDSLLFTALSAEQIDQAMEDCASRQKVLILDCCYSGAFPAGHLAKADTEVHALERFQGRGRTVLTASDSTQYSFEGNQVEGEAARSVFTRYLVEGLRDGGADLDGDGDITVDELYSYVHDRVVEEMPRQRPKKQVNVEGRTVIARNINWSVPPYLRNAISSPIAADRLGSLAGLEHLHRIGNDAVRASVRGEVQRLAGDDSRQVSAAAAQWLQSISAPPAGSLPARSPETPPVARGERPVTPVPRKPPPSARKIPGPPEAETEAEAPEPVTGTPESAALGTGPAARSGRALGVVRALGTAGGAMGSRQQPLAPAAGLLAITASVLLILGVVQGGVSASVFPHVLLPPVLVWCVAVLAVAAGGCAILPRTRSLVGPGALLGSAAASTSGLAYITWGLTHPSGKFSTSAGGGYYGLEFAGHLVLISAGAVAGLALVRDPAAHFVPARPRDLFRRTAVILGGLGMLALLGQFQEVLLAQRTDARFDAWAPASLVAAVLALALPAFSVVMAPRRLRLALLSGWIAGGVPILLGMLDLADDGNHSLHTASHLEAWVLQVPVLGFGCTLLLLAVAVAWLRHADPPTAPGPGEPASAEAGPATGPRRRTVIVAALAVAALPVAIGWAIIGSTETYQLIVALAISGDGSRLYCSNSEDPASIWVIDTVTSKIIAGPMPIGPFSFPYSLAVSPDDHYVYVTGGDSDSVLVIDTKLTEPAGKPIPVGKNPAAVAVSPDGRRVYVANRASGDVSVIDTALNELAATIPVGSSPAAVAVSPDGRRVYVANSSSPASVSVIDTATGKTGHPIPVGTSSGNGDLTGIAVSPDGRRIYVANSSFDAKPASVSVIDTATGKATGNSIPIVTGLGNHYLSGIAVSPDGGRVYVASSSAASITVIDTANYATVGSFFPVGSIANGIAVSPDGRRLYTGGSGGVVSIETSSGGSELMGISS